MSQCIYLHDRRVQRVTMNVYPRYESSPCQITLFTLTILDLPNHQRNMKLWQFTTRYSCVILDV